MRLAGVTCLEGVSRRPTSTDNIAARCLGRRFPVARSAGRFVVTRGVTGDKGDNTNLAPKVNTSLRNRSLFPQESRRRGVNQALCDATPFRPSGTSCPAGWGHVLCPRLL